MKDIRDVRRGLWKIPRAIEDSVRPDRPRFGGNVTKLDRADATEIGEGSDPAAPEHRLDLRDAESLFRELDEAVGTRGIEALAWYHPFHLSADQWGIYIPLTSVHYGAERWFNPRMRRSRRAGLAFEVLLNHEVIHYACDYAVAQFELLLQACCWAPARERLKKANLGWLNGEEALANANSIRQLALTESASTTARFHQALLQSPPGYRDFPQAVSDDGFQDHMLEVLRHNAGIPAADLRTGFLEPAFDALALFPDLKEVKWTRKIGPVD